MAAYGALTSLMHIIQQIQQHPHPPISLDKQSLESLTENISFLQEFLEDYSHVSQDLESRIADAAYSAEDIIESHVVDQIHVGSLNRGKRISSVALNESLHKVIEDMDSIKKEVIRDKPDQLHKIPSAGLSRSSAGQKRSCTAMVGFDEVLYQVKDKLTGGESKLQIISLVGMGGIGKTTLARNVYADPVLDRYFDILAWVTVSQEWAMREILLQLLKEEGENLSKLDDGELGERLYRRIFDRKYLIIMDDIWDIKVLDKLNIFFPNNNNGSRLVLTTRMYNLTCQIPSCVGIELNFLNEDDSWELFCKNAFGKEADRSAEIEVIGKKIVRSCKGLPLSIVVIGGLLSRSQQTLEHWEHVAENLNSIVNLENDEHCLQILYMSYNILPVHLKSCFLYMGVFPEDTEISVSELIKLWVVEGFIKPVDGKSLEEVAKECLYELIDRNLVLVEMVRLLGKIKSIKIHDLLLDLCLREAKKHKFLCLVRGTGDGIPRGIHTERRICTRRSVPTEALESASLARSLTWQFQEAIPASGLRLLRVYSTTDRSSDIDEVDSVEAVFRRVNLRYMYVNVGANVSGIPSSISLLWNLQTLIVNMSLFNEVTAPSEIWGMTQLRHVDCMALRLPDLPSSHTCVLASLHTLRIVLNLKCSQEVVRIIPNIKNLRITYDRFNLASVENLDRLSKLESLHLHLDDDGGLGLGLGNVNHLTFPHSLKKLSLTSNVVHWEDMRLTNIGSLPLLQVLKISLHGSKWETVEGEFCSLKVLLIRDCDLECWITDSTHFPRLENLILERLDELKEMPSSLGDISTLEFIWLEDCSTCAVDCVKRIQEEQEEFGNVFLHILVRPEQVIEDES